MATNENQFATKCKRFFANRAVLVTVVTLLVAAGIILAVTISANRSKNPTPVNPGESGTSAPTTPGTEAPVINDETLPTYNGAETRPVGAEPEDELFALPVTGKLQKGHDTTIQVYSNTMGD